MDLFSNDFFSGNRKRLQAALPDQLLVFAANSLVQSAADMAFPFRQDSSFWYFTGINEPDVVLVIDTKSKKSTLYLPEKNDYQNEWDGEFNTVAIAKVSGIQEIGFKSDLKRILKQAAKEDRKIGYLAPLPERVEPYGFYANPARRELEKFICEQASCTREELIDIRKDVARLRQVKQPVEIEAIQKAIDITGESLQEIQKNLHSYTTEKEAQRALSAAFLTRGSDRHAFEPIVAGGPNAAIIHYEKSEDALHSGELVLFDVGADYGGYAADISRVYAIGGAPTKRQQELWGACLEIQQYAFDLLGPGVIIREYQKQVEAKTQEVLKRIKCSMADKPFPHGFSHFLGLDPHDAGVYDEPLVAGSVLTVEPGIYLPDEGIGVRVEDDVLITESGIKILSESIPKLL